MADEEVLKGSQTKCSLIGRRSSSLKRVARCCAAAEVQVANNGQEDLEHTLLAYVLRDVTWTRRLEELLGTDAADQGCSGY